MPSDLTREPANPDEGANGSGVRIEITVVTMERKSRESLVEGFNLTNWRSLDTYMRRKGFTWDSINQTYVPATTKIDNILEELSSSTPIKAEMIIKRFEEMGDDSDPRAIATEFGFHDHNERG